MNTHPPLHAISKVNVFGGGGEGSRGGCGPTTGLVVVVVVGYGMVRYGFCVRGARY